MRTNFYNDIVIKWTGNISLEEKIMLLFNKVRDIPYGSICSRNPKDVYLQQKGTCSGKHELLKGLYKSLGIPVKDYIILHSFNNLPVKYPKNIKEFLAKNKIVDPHNFLKIKIEDNWIVVDVTWDLPLKNLGFPVNENWNGKVDGKISVAQGGKIMETDNPILKKQELLSEFSVLEQKNRKQFLRLLTNWLEEERENLK
ncbi:hypothetical protein [Lutibacter sp.]|uniref:hypothetical protein n=1 Tax=Lutibacter sp. TaxID=1925666 RepID=UPI0025BBA265|nr:hypothetical protein [Lutibacter sp.]MCF6182286.1 hypothetical protein [Lutibacter sp.]